MNAVVVLSEDRFLARSNVNPSPFSLVSRRLASHRRTLIWWVLLSCLVGWGRAQPEPGFGSSYDNSSVKARTINLINSMRTVMRSMFVFYF